jgi:hypothetical protein
LPLHPDRDAAGKLHRHHRPYEGQQLAVTGAAADASTSPPEGAPQRPLAGRPPRYASAGHHPPRRGSNFQTCVVSMRTMSCHHCPTRGSNPPLLTSVTMQSVRHHPLARGSNSNPALQTAQARTSSPPLRGAITCTCAKGLGGRIGPIVIVPPGAATTTFPDRHPRTLANHHRPYEVQQPLPHLGNQGMSDRVIIAPYEG